VRGIDIVHVMCRFAESESVVTSSAHLFALNSTTVQRSFGLNHFTASADIPLPASAAGSEGLLSISHTLFPPFGTDPLLIDTVTLTNPSTSLSMNVSHYEYFDVNRHQLQTQWIRTGLAAEPGDLARDLLNELFVQSVQVSVVQFVLFFVIQMNRSVVGSGIL
jgi:hypothetical protein